MNWFRKKRPEAAKQASEVAAVNVSKKQKKMTIGVCGFYGDGRVLSEIVEEKSYILDFFEKDDPAKDLDSFDGVIVPSGVFERISYKSDIYGDPYAQCDCDHGLLLEREKQMINLVREGKWFCFLVDQVVDEIPSQNAYRREEIRDTDLCKRMLNTLGIRRKLGEYSIVNCKADEFRKYITKYGAGKTELGVESDSKVLAEAPNGHVLGAVFSNFAFFLPFHKTSPRREDVIEVSKWVAEGVLEYRVKNEVSLPEWLNEVKFEEEEKLQSLSKDLVTQLGEIEKRTDTIAKWKGILTTSGDNLVELVKAILVDYFGLNVDSKDVGKDDLRVLEDDKVVALIEIKGQNKGVKRENINQVDSHRDRCGLPGDFPAMLLINDNMKIDGYVNRSKIEVVQEQVDHAVKMKIVIFRTVDFIYFMKSVESLSIQERGSELMKVFDKCGWYRPTIDEAPAPVEADTTS